MQAAEASQARQHNNAPSSLKIAVPVREKANNNKNDSKIRQEIGSTKERTSDLRLLLSCLLH
jgi:hypothetical protein